MPPLNMCAPLRITSFAISESIFSDSIVQGPAITVKLPPPIETPPTEKTVSSGYALLSASL